MESSIGFGGKVSARVRRADQPGLAWKLRNILRLSFLWGALCYWLARVFTRLTGIPTMVGRLSARLVRANGQVINYGVVSYRLVTDASVAYLVDMWDAATAIALNYHASGTGTTAKNVNQTALVTESTGITDRATGTKSQPSANVLQSQATQSFTNSGAITEHGLYSVVTESTGTLWDRSLFAALNVANGDSIQWTYQCTINSGG